MGSMLSMLLLLYALFLLHPYSQIFPSLLLPALLACCVLAMQLQCVSCAWQQLSKIAASES